MPACIYNDTWKHNSTKYVDSILPGNFGKKYCSMDHRRFAALQRIPDNHDPNGNKNLECINISEQGGKQGNTFFYIGQRKCKIWRDGV